MSPGAQACCCQGRGGGHTWNRPSGTASSGTWSGGRWAHVSKCRVDRTWRVPYSPDLLASHERAVTEPSSGNGHRSPRSSLHTSISDTLGSVIFANHWHYLVYKLHVRQPATRTRLRGRRRRPCLAGRKSFPRWRWRAPQLPFPPNGGLAQAGDLLHFGQSQESVRVVHSACLSEFGEWCSVRTRTIVLRAVLARVRCLSGVAPANGRGGPRHFCNLCRCTVFRGSLGHEEARNRVSSAGPFTSVLWNASVLPRTLPSDP